MKKVKKEISEERLTYTPFENIKDLLKQNNNKNKEARSHGNK